ncbi:MAG: beta-propeller domain-containing protein [Oscillospiraceae bacterium]
MNDNNSFDDIKEKIAGDDIELPKSLQKENIVLKIKEENIKSSPKKTNYKRYIALAASFVIVVAAIAVGGKMLSLEKEKSPISKISAEDFNAAPIKNSNDYAEIEKFFLDKQKAYKKNNNKFNLFGNKQNSNLEAGSPEMGADETAKKTDSESSQFGGTNLQVKNVDEADIVKNDGKYLYTVSANINSKVIIANVENPKDLKIVSSIDFQKEDYYTQIVEIYQSGDTLIIIKNSNLIKNEAKISGTPQNEIAIDGAFRTTMLNAKTSAVIFDISDRANPKNVNEISLDGFYISSRLVNNRLYLITNYSVPLFKDDKTLKDNCIPSYYKGEEKVKFSTNSIKLLKDNNESSYTCLALIDIKDKEKDVKTLAVLGGSSQCYSTENKLFLARNFVDEKVSDDVVSNNNDTVSSSIISNSERTQIFMFDIGEDIQYNCFGEVDGSILNQFSMDQYNGYFRIATTLNSNSSNSITILDMKLQKVGEITNLAKGERIYAVRFMGDTAYTVTFKQTDPLFVIDLKNPVAPTVLGEVKVPGFSNYLHPYSDKYVIGIGRDGTQNGANNGLKVSLFDISDKANPKEVSKITYNGRYVESPVQNSHKAYLSINNTNEFAIPINKTIGSSNKTESYLSLITVENNSLKISGKYGEGEKNQSYSDDGIIRGTYINNTIFTISNNDICSYDKTSGEKLDKLLLN